MSGEPFTNEKRFDSIIHSLQFLVGCLLFLDG